MLAIILKGNNSSYKLVSKSLEKGLILFYLLFEPKAVRITPPLTISNIDIKKGCEINHNLFYFNYTFNKLETYRTN